MIKSSTNIDQPSPMPIERRVAVEFRRPTLSDFDIDAIMGSKLSMNITTVLGSIANICIMLVI